MILHGNQRGGAKDLAQHLLKEENEHVEVHELRGFMSDDLTSALNEAYFISKGTKAKKFLYSLSLNPPENEKVPTQAFIKAIEQVEKKLKLEGQPRAIVFHEKHGRRHCHTVWSRIDSQKMKAIHMPNDWPKLMDVSRGLFAEHGWDMPRGMINGEERNPSNFTMAQWQQAKRIGKDPRQIKRAFQSAWALSDSKSGFENALKEQGYRLAKGDSRGFVALDHRCEVFSVPKWAGVKTKNVRARLGPESELRSVSEVRAAIAHDMATRLSALQDEQISAIAARTKLIHERRLRMVEQQKRERKKLKQTQDKRRQAETRQRQARFNKGLRGIMDRVTGKHRRIKKQNEREAASALQRDRNEKDTLIFTHIAQWRSLQSRMQRLEKFGKTSADHITRDITQYQDISGQKRDLFELRKSQSQKQVKRGPTLER